MLNDYQRSLGSGIPLPVADYAFFVNDLVDILDNRNIGLMEYPPYLDFVSNMEGLNALRLDEMERFSSNAIVLPEGMEFVTIPSGSFMMGSPESEDGRSDGLWDAEGPLHSVNISSFEIMTTEVTQGMWEDVMGDNSSYGDFGLGRNYPISSVTWNECQEFIEKLNDLDPSYTYRLPSESEWEYACRAGTTTRFYWGEDPELSEIAKYAWYGNDREDQLYPVAMKLPNSWGLYDMSGNVLEWCQDALDLNHQDYDYVGAPSDGSAWGDEPNTLYPSSVHILRGGSYCDSSQSCRSASRRNNPAPMGYYHDWGFRLARSVR